MSLVFAGVVPHNPALLPSINKEQNTELEPIVQVFASMAERIKTLDLDTLIVISPHAPQLDETFGLNLRQSYQASFETFGDLVTKQTYKGDIELAYQTKEHIEANLPFHIYSEKVLDHGTSVPLHFLTQKKSVSIIPISISQASVEQHLAFGKALRKKTDLSSKKVGVVASFHSSHSGQEQTNDFESDLQTALQNRDIKRLQDLYNQSVAAQSCGYLGLIALMGMTEQIKAKTNILAFHRLFDIGHLLAEIEVLS